MARQMLTPKELADYLGAPLATLYQWRTKGPGPKGCRVGRHIRYRPEDVERWLEANTDAA